MDGGQSGSLGMEVRNDQDKLLRVMGGCVCTRGTAVASDVYLRWMVRRLDDVGGVTLRKRLRAAGAT